MIEQKLIKLGLTEEEAKIYLACLEIGSNTADKISEKAGVDKVNTYLTLDLLMSRGLMSNYIEENISYFLAESPERLLDYLEEKQKDLGDKITSLIEVIPDLISIADLKGGKPKVRFFEGIGGLKSVQEDFVKTMDGGGIIYTFLPYDDFYDSSLKNRILSPENKRFKKGIKMKIIYTSKNGRQKDYEKREKKFLKEFRYVNFDKYPIKGGMNIYGNKIFLIDYSGKASGIVVENKTLAHMMTCLFGLAWSKIS